MRPRTSIIAGCFLLISLTGAAFQAVERLDEADYVPLDHKAIQYAHLPVNDPVARLEDRIEKGQVKLEFQPGRWGYLPSVLKQLDVNTDSQVLVFSKTSVQNARITPRTPRAIYFNDSVAVGFVQGGQLELSSLDPKQGVNFYTLNNDQSTEALFARRDECLVCHQGAQTLAVPGLMVSSVRPDEDGTPSPHRSFITDDRTPLIERWGGWFVTGMLGGQKNLGNAVTERPNEARNLSSLAGLLDTSLYMAPTSDVVALMTLEHQSLMTNFIARIGWEMRIAAADGKLEESKKRLDSAVEEMVTYMLFAEAAPILEPIQGVSTFAKTFPQRGPRDKQGRSLRDFDLQKRLFRYPLSYMVYSEAFDGMPDIARERVYHRLYEVLTAKEADPKFARLSSEDRRAVLEIVRDTKPDLPAYWKSYH